jgi:anthranilate phosphoribosyltransferase
MIVEHLTRVLDGHHLTREAMAACMGAVLKGEAAPAQVAALLGALRVRGETVEELVGAVTAVRAAAIRVPAHVDVVDTCGTGGDSRGTFNISTAAAFVASACGVTVAKHGNRSVSSKCGSADVLEAMGVRLDLDATTLASLLERQRLAFLFAPAHHPAFKNVAALRRELGVRTVFNLVGPLANPAGATRQVLGVFDGRLAPLMADVLLELGARHALVVHGDGLDEISVSGPTVVEEVLNGTRRRFEVTPEALGLTQHAAESLRGGDAHTNARIIRGVLEGQVGGPRDAVLANAAAALLVGGVVGSLREGVERAAEVIDAGAALAHVERFVRVQGGGSTMLDDIVSRLPASAAVKVGPRPTGGRFKAALSTRGGPTRIIAEVKRRSPSAGAIAEIPDAGLHAKTYVDAGAAAISVLTNGADFGGSLADLTSVRRAVDVPVLRKEFIVDPRQLDEAAHAGADAVLLIVAVLGGGLERMVRAARARGLDALVEVHDEAELTVALSAGADLIGINNRDLRTFVVDLSVSERLAARIPEQVRVIAESGIRSQDDLERLRRAGLSNFLVGEFLVRGGRLS